MLPYFNEYLHILGTMVIKSDGGELTRFEQVFLSHLAQGGSSQPSGRWKGFVEFPPNTVSKMVSTKRAVEDPLIVRFSGRKEEL